MLTVTASDFGGRTDTATVYVNISDANNFAPVFENAPYSASVFEDAPVGTTVLVVSATDNDVGLNAQITYALGEEVGDSNHVSDFTINPQTGAIVTTRTLDREMTGGYLLTVTAKDGGNPPLSDTTDVEISVTDVNDNFPVFKQPMYSGSVLEDALVGEYSFKKKKNYIEHAKTLYTILEQHFNDEIWCFNEIIENLNIFLLLINNGYTKIFSKRNQIKLPNFTFPNANVSKHFVFFLSIFLIKEQHQNLKTLPEIQFCSFT